MQKATPIPWCMYRATFLTSRWLSPAHRSLPEVLSAYQGQWSCIWLERNIHSNKSRNGTHALTRTKGSYSLNNLQFNLMLTNTPLRVITVSHELKSNLSIYLSINLSISTSPRYKINLYSTSFKLALFYVGKPAYPLQKMI